MNWFSDRRIWSSKAHRLWIFVINRADSRILKTQWIVDQLWILVQILDCACLDIWILGSKRDLDGRSFFSLGRYVNEFTQIISIFGRISFKLRCETVIGIVLCHSRQACYPLYCLCEVNKWMAFTFTSLPSLNFYTFVSVCGFADWRIWWKKAIDWQICIPLFTPPPPPNKRTVTLMMSFTS